MVHFGEFLKTWSLRSNRVTRQVSFNRTKNGGKCQNSNATFWVIFKQCVWCQKSKLLYENLTFLKILLNIWLIILFIYTYLLSFILHILEEGKIWMQWEVHFESFSNDTAPTTVQWSHAGFYSRIILKKKLFFQNWVSCGLVYKDTLMQTSNKMKW